MSSNPAGKASGEITVADLDPKSKAPEVQNQLVFDGGAPLTTTESVDESRELSRQEPVEESNNSPRPLDSQLIAAPPLTQQEYLNYHMTARRQSQGSGTDREASLEQRQQ